MAYSIAGALLPITVTFLPGFVGARRDDFKREDASILNRMVLTYALPSMILAGTMNTSRQSTAIPVMPIVAMVALHSRFEEALAAFSLFFSLIGSVITLAVFIVLTSQAVDRGTRKEPSHDPG